MVVRDWTNNSYDGASASGIGANSLALTDNVFVSKTDGIVSIAAVWGTIAGVNYTIDTFDSDNQTVDMSRVEYNPDLNHEYLVTITWGTITVADEGKLYDLSWSAGDTVDWATESTTTGQLRLTRFISATLCAFKIANL